MAQPGLEPALDFDLDGDLESLSCVERTIVSALAKGRSTKIEVAMIIRTEFRQTVRAKLSCRRSAN